ncbi:MAG: anaerobic glycerol-3-phosphate dehydrogenase subunit C [Peptococcales bacterium]|jgi:glycerol-3-phosphate dehydrogenase subunit C
MSKGNEPNLDHCLKCSTCHTQCPVVMNHLAFPGPKQLGPELERLRLARGNQEPLEIDEALSYCTNCKRCDIACPHGVKPSYYNLKNKAKLKGAPLDNFRDWFLAHNVWWGKIASKVPNLANFGLQFPLTKVGMGIVGIAKRDFPTYRKQQIKLSKAEKAKRVLYYTGCYASYNEPEVIQATINILEACDYQVELAPVGCCGTPMVSNGLWDEASKLAEKNTDIFLKYIDQGYKIVTTCSSCGLALKEEYSHLNPGEKNNRFKENVWDLFELLDEEEKLPFYHKEKNAKKAYYHVPCHLKAQGIGVPATKLLKEMAVDELIVEDSYCCGISGTYGFKKEKYSLAMSIGAPLFKDIKEAQVPLVITDCGTCKLQIVHGTGVEVKHPAVILEKYL